MQHCMNILKFKITILNCVKSLLNIMSSLTKETYTECREKKIDVLLKLVTITTKLLIY